MTLDIRELKPILDDLPDADLQALAEVLLPRAFEDGAVICQQDDPGTSAFFIARGNVEVRVGTARSRVAVLRPGQMFGQMSLVDGGPRSATCKAVGQALVYELTSQAVTRLGRQSAQLAVRLLWRVARQLAVNLRNADILLGRLAEANPWMDLSMRRLRDQPDAGRPPFGTTSPGPARAPAAPPAVPESFRSQLEYVARNLADVDVRRVRVSATHELTGGTVRDPLRRWRG